MPPKIETDSLTVSYYGSTIYVEAWQPEGGHALVHAIEISDLPEIRMPDCGNHTSLHEALKAGLRFATSMVDN